MKILAVDPGLRTGVVEVHASDSSGKLPDVLSACTLDPFDFLDSVWWRVADMDLVVVERFTITAQTGKKSQLGMNWPLELTGAIKYVCRTRGIPLSTDQTPANALAFSTDTKLKSVGWWDTVRPKNGEDHIKSAACHALYALFSMRHPSVKGVL